MIKLIIILVVGILLLNVAFVSADGDHQSEIEEGEKLVESEINCDELNDEQLEAIGEYLMEQMHPGESHEAMHEMMGIEEGTEYHEQFHVNMAEMMYCGESGMMGSGMMNRGGSGMMANDFGYGMMGNWSPFGLGFGFIFMIIFWGLIIWLVVWIVMKFTKRESETPLEILKRRFAKGEISKKEFEDIKKKL